MSPQEQLQSRIPITTLSIGYCKRAKTHANVALLQLQIERGISIVDTTKCFFHTEEGD